MMIIIQEIIRRFRTALPPVASETALTPQVPHQSPAVTLGGLGVEILEILIALREIFFLTSVDINSVEVIELSVQISPGFSEPPMATIYKDY